MAKASLPLISSALCILAIASFAHSQEEEFKVEGKVYCDPCRVQFQTKLSRDIQGAMVELKCRDQETEKLTFEMTAKTNSTGDYSMIVKGDRELEICEVSVKDSPDASCNVLMDDLANARVSLTNRNGVKGNDRYANPIGFMTKEADPKCKEVLDAMGFVDVSGY